MKRNEKNIFDLSKVISETENNKFDGYDAIQTPGFSDNTTVTNISSPNNIDTIKPRKRNRKMKPRNYEQMEKEIEIAKKNNNHDQARKITAKMNSQKSRDLQA